MSSIGVPGAGNLSKTKKLALTFFSVLRMPIEDIIACSLAAEEAGFTHIAVAESFYRDGFALASAIASKTSAVELGTSVMPIFTRTPFQLATGAATLNELSGGRFGFLGLGVGYRSRTEQYFGIQQGERLDRMREYVEIIRKLLSGEDATHSGRLFRFEGFPTYSDRRLDIPIYFGSTAPRMLELAGEVADGVILNSISTQKYLDFARTRIATGAKKAGRNESEVEIGHSIIYSVAEESEDAIRAAKEDILFYVSYPELNPVIARSSFRRVALEMRDRLHRGDREGALSLIDSQMLKTFAVYGTPSECGDRLRAFVASRRITLPIIRVSVTPYKVGERRSVFMRAIESLRGWRAD